MGTRRPNLGQELPKSKPETSITAAEYFLKLRILSDTKKYAIRAREADPFHPAPGRLLSIASVLSAPTIWGGRPDYYAILNLPRFESSDAQIQASFDSLILILNPNTNPYPFASEAFDVVIKAWSVLKKPIEKAKFDDELRRFLVGGNSGTFWTMCPYCYHVFEYEHVYEDCCMKCPNLSCRRAFQAVAIAGAPPPPEIMEKESYFCPGFVPFGCGGDDEKVGNMWNPFKPLESGFVSYDEPFVKEGGCNGEAYVIDISDEEKEVYGQGNSKKKKVGVEDVMNGGIESGFLGDELLDEDVNVFGETVVGGEACDGVKRSEVEFFQADDDVMVDFQGDVDLGN